ncbi:hypothetical protein GCM10010329_52080 [Streptomyces spiroverticillatus]|uniref:Uncharacterized protein n=1 Tax=Streptomyces finlayi TaxID=67296 RepID=A0A919CCB0_9ACTN|nr:hypothetical protein [Streptomyces finlayi]GHA22333.1 hypothetical protein GCM10010329_52080 [Streptomyces spiroverticillatus]GHD04335.1 hypothetical protein GCM10010334_53020 [Streptomyces finlayi]
MRRTALLATALGVALSAALPVPAAYADHADGADHAACGEAAADFAGSTYAQADKSDTISFAEDGTYKMTKASGATFEGTYDADSSTLAFTSPQGYRTTATLRTCESGGSSPASFKIDGGPAYQLQG